MPAVGPQLPAEFQKRKRGDDDDDEGDSSDSSTGPLPPPQASARQPSPPVKRPRVMGPTLPPAPLHERPPSTPPRALPEDSESDNDDFGPALPSANQSHHEISSVPADAPVAEAPKRDEWMTMAPTNGDWSARVDPTKLKNRKFNTGRGAKGPSQDSNKGQDSTWYETPEEKQARLKREVMGIQDRPGSGTSSKAGPDSDARDAATARRLKEYNETVRGSSLVATHTSSLSESLDDDPSARAFDREKDIGSGLTINATKRREMLKKAADFSTRFGKASYL